MSKTTVTPSNPTSIVTPTPTFSPELTAEQDATLDSTANWKTYKNDKFGFELKYPTTIEFVSVDSTKMWISGRRVNPYLELNIKVSEQSSEEVLQHDGVLEWGKQKQLIAGVLTDVYSGMSGEGGAYSVHAFALQNTGKTYYFNIATSGKWEEVDQILSTFKFTESTTSAKYTCPTSGWVDCMPGPEKRPECSAEAMSWYKTNCPNFQGGAL